MEVWSVITGKCFSPRARTLASSTTMQPVPGYLEQFPMMAGERDKKKREMNSRLIIRLGGRLRITI